MDYSKHYTLLINKFGTKERGESYKELHHIVPRCMGGSDDPDNLTYLSPRVHFVAHFLLWKLHRTSKLAHAFNMMCNKTSKGNSRSPRNYAIARKAHSESMRSNNPMHRKEVADKISGDNHYMKTQKWREYFSENRKGSKNPMYGKKNIAKSSRIQTEYGEFNSINEASNKIGLGRAAIRRRLVSKEFSSWYYIGTE
jgi:hypothetical protein